ncbi:MAG: tRNA lysidine(34) synthetase TilS, partial [Bradymonadaceae bacterium]
MLWKRLDRLLPDGDGAEPTSVALAWSGGLDSTVLVHLALSLRRRRPIELAAVHVDHGLRPGAGRDARWCRRRARAWGLPLTVVQLDLASGRTDEQRARRARYAALARAARRLGLDEIWTGHHADDALETALLQFVRGAGPSAMGSLASERKSQGGPLGDSDGVVLGRPLVATPREALLDHAEAHQLEWREDPTNVDPSYRRNRLRSQVDRLREEAGSRRPMLHSLANLEQTGELVASRVDALWASAAIASPLRFPAFETDTLAEAHEAAVTGLLRRLARRTSGAGTWKRPSLVDAVRAIRSRARPDGRADPTRITLPGAVLVVDSERTRLVPVRGRGSRALARRRARPVALNRTTAGHLRWFGWELVWSAPGASLSSGDEDRSRLRGRLRLPAGAPDRLVVRGPRPGERFEPNGFDGTHPIRDSLREAGIPPTERWRWPCLAAPPEEDGSCL